MDHSLLLKKYSIQYLSKYDSTKKNLKRVLRNKILRMKNIQKNEKLMLYESIFKVIEEYLSNISNNKDIQKEINQFKQSFKDVKDVTELFQSSEIYTDKVSPL